MRVLLVNPKNQYDAGEGEVWARFPIGLLYVAAGLAEHEVRILDLNAGEDLVEALKSFRPDEVGISCWMDNFLSTEEIIATVKSTCNAKIVAGGPYASVTPQTYLDLGVDEVSRGMYFFPSSDQLIAAYKEHFPLSRMERYLGGSERFPTHRAAMVLTSFACPHHCSFCSADYLGRYHERDLADVEAEIAFLNAEYGTNALYLADASLCTRRGRTIEICEITKKYQIKWYAEARVDELDQELVETMADAGCVQLLIGVETFDQSILNAVGKRTTRDQNLAAIRMIQAAGIDLSLFILFGLPGQTEQQIEEVIQEVKRLQTFVVPNMLFPIPGTPVWRVAEEQGKAPNPADLARKISGHYDAAGRAFPSINLTQVSDRYLVEAVQEIHRLNELLTPTP